MTAQPARRRLALADDGIIDPVAVELAARGARPVALTRAERYLAAAAILARGGTPNLITQRLHVSGTTARKLAAQCDSAPTRAAPGRAQCLGPALLSTGAGSRIPTGIRTGAAAQDREQREQRQPPAGTPGRIVQAAGGQR